MTLFNDDIYQQIVNAAERMLGRGAPVVDDGMGFNKISYGAVIDLLNNKVLRKKHYERLIHHLVRHRGQASAYVDIEAIKELQAKILANPWECVYIPEDKIVWVYMPYDKALIERSRVVYGLTYDRDAKANRMPLSSSLELAREFQDIPGVKDAIMDAIKPHGLNGKMIREMFPAEVAYAKEYAASRKEGATESAETPMLTVSFDGSNEMLHLKMKKFSAEGLAAVKALPNNLRAWDKEKGVWVVSPEAHDLLISNIQKTSETYVDHAVDIAKDYKQTKPIDYDEIRASVNTDAALKLVMEQYSVLNGKKLFTHQLEGIAFMLSVPGDSCINADQTGLGKSLEAIVAAHIQKERLDDSPGLVIVPASLKINWVRELFGWLGEDAGIVQVLGTKKIETYVYTDNYNRFMKVRIKKSEEKRWGLGSVSLDDTTKADWLIVNYDIAEKMRPAINNWKKRCNVQVVIADEAHYMKNDSKRTDAVLGYTKTTKKKVIKRYPDGEREETETTKVHHEGIIEHMSVRYALTGTPVTGKNRDMLNLLKFINHRLAHKPIEFLKRYCKPENNGFGVTYNGSTNSDELFGLTATNMLQRRKQDVLDGFPSKMRQYHYIDINLDDYWDYWDEYQETYQERTGKVFNEFSAHLTELNVLRNQASKQKIPFVAEFAQGIVDEGRKVIIFTGYTETANQMMLQFGDSAVQIVGGMSANAKDAAVQAFQNDPKIKVIVCNFLAAGVGLTLTAASEILMADLMWLPSDHFQAEDRAWRIGQKNNVTIHYFIAADTHEEAVKRAVDEKGLVIDLMEVKNYEMASSWSEIVRSFMDMMPELRKGA